MAEFWAHGKHNPCGCSLNVGLGRKESSYDGKVVVASPSWEDPSGAIRGKDQPFDHGRVNLEEPIRDPRAGWALGPGGVVLATDGAGSGLWVWASGVCACICVQTQVCAAGRCQVSRDTQGESFLDRTCRWRLCGWLSDRGSPLTLPQEVSGEKARGHLPDGGAPE